MHTLEFIPGAFCSFAVVDGSLQLIENCETDDMKCFFILFISLIDLLLYLLLCAAVRATSISSGFCVVLTLAGRVCSPLTTFQTFFSERSIQHWKDHVWYVWSRSFSMP